MSTSSEVDGQGLPSPASPRFRGTTALPDLVFNDDTDSQRSTEDETDAGASLLSALLPCDVDGGHETLGGDVGEEEEEDGVGMLLAAAVAGVDISHGGVVERFEVRLHWAVARRESGITE